MATEKEQNVIKAKFCLLAKRMKLHQWTRFDDIDEAELEEEEAKIDAGDFKPPTDESCGT
jgi:hypothetical protein